MTGITRHNGKIQSQLASGSGSILHCGMGSCRLHLDVFLRIGIGVEMRFLIVSVFILCGLSAQSAAISAIGRKDGKICVQAFKDAIQTNIRKEHAKILAPIVAAIRYSENGGKGREYGILHPRCKPTYRSQAGWCAATVQKNFDRWTKAGRHGAFLEFLGRVYCPVGADNDPTGLNRHWVKNVKYYVTRFK